MKVGWMMMKLKHFLANKGLKSTDFDYLVHNNVRFIDNEVVETMLLMEYGNLAITDLLVEDSDTDTYTQIQDVCSKYNNGVNKVKYTRMMDVLTAQYNPLWNVDGEVTITKTGTDIIENEGKDTYAKTGDETFERTSEDTKTLNTRNAVNTDIKESTNADTTNSFNYANNGEKTTTVNKEQKGTLTSDGAFNSGSYSDIKSGGVIDITTNANKLVNTRLEIEDNLNNEGITETKTGGHSENFSANKANNYTETQGSVLNNYTDNTGTETLENSEANTTTYNTTDTRTISNANTTTYDTTETTLRTGNIGVTSSQSLVMEEIEVAKINLYKIIVDDIKNAITTIEWELE